MTATCERCHRPLSDPESMKFGMGPVCRSKAGGGNDLFKDEEDGSIAALPFDPESMDVVCRRVPTGQNDLAGNPMLKPVTNINQAVISHSPTGFEWGYGGSGPADFALNILNLFVPVGSDGFKPVKCYRGECSSTAWTLHQDFKWEMVSRLPRQGGVLRGERIRAWIEAHKGKVQCGGCYSNPCVCHEFE